MSLVTMAADTTGAQVDAFLVACLLYEVREIGSNPWASGVRRVLAAPHTFKASKELFRALQEDGPAAAVGGASAEYAEVRRRATDDLLPWGTKAVTCGSFPSLASFW